MVRFHILGPIELLNDQGHAVQSILTQPKRMGLLAYLALENPGGLHRRDTLLALFWPESDEPRARAALSQALYFLRRSLGENVIASRGDEEVGVVASALTVDALEFRAALRERRLEDAVGLYRAELMHGFHMGASAALEHWLDGMRAELKTAAADTAMALAQQYMDNNAAADAAHWARRALAIDPDDARASTLLATAERQPASAAPRPHGRSSVAPDPGHRRPDLRLLAGLGALFLLSALGVREGLSDRTAAPGEGIVPPSTASSGIGSLAVLPLSNLSGDPDQEYFTVGMTEALTAELGHIGADKVISGTSAMRYRETDKALPAIARELGVDYLIEGSVLRAGNDVRITVRLVHGPTDRHIWSASYERPLDDVLALQRDGARNIAAAVRTALDPSIRPDAAGPTRPAPSRTPDPAAYDAYLKGRFHFNRYGEESFRTALNYYRHAVSLDSTFALAYAALAEVCMMPGILYTLMAPAECRSRAATAVRLDPERAEGYAALGMVRLMLDWDWEGSEAAFRRALDLNPHSIPARQWYSQLLRTLTRSEESLELMLRAEELDPFNLFVKTMVGWSLLNLRRYDDALAQWDEVLDMDPEYGLALFNQGVVYWVLGEPELVFDRARRAAVRLGETSIQVLVLTAAGHALMGDRPHALRTLEMIQERHAGRISGPTAAVHLTLGDERAAFEWLERGVRTRTDARLPGVTSGPRFDSLREHPRFRALRRSMGLD